MWADRWTARFAPGTRRGAAIHYLAADTVYARGHQLAPSQGHQYRAARAHPLRRHVPNAARDARIGDGALGGGCRPRYVHATARTFAIAAAIPRGANRGSPANGIYRDAPRTAAV